MLEIYTEYIPASSDNLKFLYKRKLDEGWVWHSTVPIVRGTEIIAQVTFTKS